MMEAFLVAAPRPAPNEETVEAMRAWVAGESPLVALRVRCGLRRDDLVDAVMTEFKLPSGKRSIVKRYVHRLEAGLLDPRRLSAPLLSMLEGILRTPAKTILAARVRPLEAAPAFREAMMASAALADSIDHETADDDDPEIASLFLSER
jgi:hypothetical protein